MKLEVGALVTRIFGHKIENWKITRIELESVPKGMSLIIFACPEKWYDKHFNNKEKLYHNDELYVNFYKGQPMQDNAELQRRIDLDKRMKETNWEEVDFPENLFDKE